MGINQNKQAMSNEEKTIGIVFYFKGLNHCLPDTISIGIKDIDFISAEPLQLPISDMQMNGASQGTMLNEQNDGKIKTQSNE